MATTLRWRQSLAKYPKVELAIGQARLHGVTVGDVCRRAHDMSCIVKKDGVAALQRGKRTHGMQRVAGMPQGGLLALQGVGDGAAQSLILFGQSTGEQRQSRTWMQRQQAGMQPFESGMPALALFAQYGTQTPLDRKSVV